MPIHRRHALALLATTALPLRRAAAQGIALSFATAGPGSAFLPYGQGIAKAIAGSGIVLDIKESKGVERESRPRRWVADHDRHRLPGLRARGADRHRLRQGQTA